MKTSVKFNVLGVTKFTDSAPFPDLLSESRLDSVQVPQSLRSVLLDFSLSFLIECPKDVIEFGYKYFKNIKKRKRQLKKEQVLSEQGDSSDYSDSKNELNKKKTYCFKCSRKVGRCGRCKKTHKICYNCTKLLKQTPFCVMASAAPKPPKSEAGDAPVISRRQNRRKCVFSEGLNEKEAEEWTPPSFKKSSETKNNLINYFTGKTLFKDLEPSEIEELVDAMFVKDVFPNELLIRQGRGGDFFYVVESGEYTSYIKDEEGNTRTINNYNNEGCFGELALLYNVPRGSSVKALTGGKVWVLDRETFRKCVIKGAMRKREVYMSMLSTIQALKKFKDSELMNLADSMEMRSVKKDDKIISSEEEFNGILFVHKGQLVVSFEINGGEEVFMKTLEEGSQFIYPSPETKKWTNFTVLAEAEGSVVFLKSDTFDRLLGTSHELALSQVGEQSSSAFSAPI